MSDAGWRTRIRWVVLHPDQPKVLAMGRRGALDLPETERAGQVWTADPEEVLPALAELLGAEAVLLRCLKEDEDPAARVQRATLAAVPRGTPPLPAGATWVGRGELEGVTRVGRGGLEEAVPGADEQDPGRGGSAAPAAMVLADLEAGHSGDARQPWVARGWFAAAERWLGSAMAATGRPLTGPVRQVRVWELSCVLRAPTSAGDVWFKANGDFPLFVNEGVVMAALAELFPGRVPAPLAVAPERGWMVLADFGRELGWRQPVEVVEQVTRAFARLQIEAATQVDRLLEAGCLDRRLDRLAAEARAWLPRVEATGRLPGIDAATWLSDQEMAALRAAVPRLTEACAELAGYGVPPTLVHGDLHLANVANGHGGFLFFDWTDACVAHPFLDLPTIRRGTAFAEEEGEAELRDRVRDACLAEWAAFESPERLRRAWELAMPLGALHQALSYRTIVALLRPPVELHLARSTAWWLRQVLAWLPEGVGQA